MSVSSTHCNALYQYYLAQRAYLDSLNNYYPELVTGIDTALTSVTDNMLDSIDLTGVGVPVPLDELDTYRNSLEQALIDCPALIYVYPQSVRDAVNVSLDYFQSVLSGSILEDILSSLRSTTKIAIDSIIDTEAAIALNLLETYRRIINKSGISDLLIKLNTMESCLVAVCNLVVESERKANTYYSNWRILPSGNLDINTFATDAGLTYSKLATAYSEYISKFNFNF